MRFRIHAVTVGVYVAAFALLAFVAYSSLAQRDRALAASGRALTVAEELADSLTAVRLRERALRYQPPVILFRSCPSVPGNPEGIRRL